MFLHEVAPGSADRSYGIHVARLAGLPESVLRRAAAVLKRLEEGEARSPASRLADDLPLFAALRRDTAPEPTPPSPALEVLAGTDPDQLTAKAALDLVYRLKKLLVEDGSDGHIDR